MTSTVGQIPAPPLSGSAERALRQLARESGARALDAVRGADLLMERARLLGLTFTDRLAPGGACRLLDTADGVLAVNLPRESDWELLPAWLDRHPGSAGSWESLGDAVLDKPSNVLLDRARTLGLAVAAVVAPAECPPPFHRVQGPPLVKGGARPGQRRPPRVVDLSSLWAGPLCTHLLKLCGAEVIKVESHQRPDGAREGNGAFFDLLNQGKRSVALDFGSAEGRLMLRRLIDAADIVIEASRPRALEQLGLYAGAIVRSRPGLTWVSITGYGREEPHASWIAFGDDAGVAAGLSQVMTAATGSLQFAGDAIADPLSGIHAALAAWRSWHSGGGRLIALALADVAGASFAEESAELGPERLHGQFGRWWAAVRGHRLDPARGLRPVPAAASPLGADTQAVLAEIGASC